MDPSPGKSVGGRRAPGRLQNKQDHVGSVDREQRQKDREHQIGS